jgi:hypothetical protein
VKKSGPKASWRLRWNSKVELAFGSILSKMLGKHISFLIVILAALVGIAGCLSTTIGAATYDGESVHIGVDNTDEPIENAVLQVVIVELQGLSQEEVFKEARYVNLDSGPNEYAVQVDLQPGTYKLFLTVFVGNDRRASVIRELEV